MSDGSLDELAEAASNRGLRLVRSRVRTPGKKRFGKVGLTDRAGKPVLGMDAKGPTGKPEEVAEYLRNLDAKDWGASLDVAVLPRKRRRKPVREAANDREPERAPPPKPQVREARPADAPRLAELIRDLGHEIDEKSVRKNLSALKKTDETPLVATIHKEVAGLCGVSARVMIHREVPVGRISPLVVAKEAQGHGIGRMLVEAAEDWMRKKGCRLVEVTSNDRRAEAHAFYRHMGYERTSIRFAKKL
ncbi:MAG TPA: GNAT family N-acetyltransferase [Sphingomicrobium sp.]|nr:GNAT family N-acetyltransferase [Sphingomicrobium sp.]